MPICRCLQSREDKGAVLESFTLEQRQLAAGLYNANVGCDLSVLGSGLENLLEPMTEPFIPGFPANYLKGVYYREALQVSADGTSHLFP